MIYSTEINKVCAVCQKARKHNENEMYCEKNERTVPVSGEGCKFFSYDILKKPVRRMRRLKTSYKKEDFEL